MASPPTIKDEDIPRFIRRCYEQYRDATDELRKAEKESRGFWIGGDKQWREGEVGRRRSNNRPILTINRCKPAVDQVVNEAIQNPPGPQAHPVGEGADQDGADILEGLIREVEYRTNAHVAYITAMKYACAGGRGVFELTTDYVDERSMEQELCVKEIEDPDMVFIDPAARMWGRQDAGWGGKIRVYSRDQLISEFGSDLKILKRGYLQEALGWMQDAVQDTVQSFGFSGWKGNQASINEWTGGAANEGPYYVCEFYRVVVEDRKLTLYDDNILRFNDEPVPEGVAPKKGEDGPIARSSPRRIVRKYVSTALDLVKKTDWMGDLIPYFWIFGPEMYNDGKLYRQSLITGAIDPNRLLNYATTSAAEIVGVMTKTPWIGYQGQFDGPNAQRGSPWDSSNTEVYPYLEIKPTFLTPPDGGQAILAPPPIRNTWEAPIVRILELCNFAAEQVKAATSVFFEPSVQSAQNAQSGSAIKALQAQSNIGTVNWQEALQNVVALAYNQMAIIFPKMYDGPRVRTIVRPDGNHEIMAINQEFPEDAQQTDKAKRNSIAYGKYSLRVTAGPSFETRADESIAMLTSLFKVAPNLAQIPGFISRFVRLVGQGNPIVEQMADSIPGGNPMANGKVSVEQLSNLLTAEQQKSTVLLQEIQKLQQTIQTKSIESHTKLETAAISGLATIRSAEIKAGVDKSDIDTRAFESMLDAAHDAATSQLDRDHAAQLQQSQQDHAMAQQQLAGQQAQEQQASEPSE